MVSLALCAVKANAIKNWQSQHLINLKVFTSETLCKRIALVSLHTALVQKLYFTSLFLFNI